MQIKYEISGTYEISVYGSDGKLKTHIPEFKNLIVDQGMDRFGNNAGSGWGIYAFAGSGNATPANGNTTMQSFLGETNDVVSDQAESTYTTPRYVVHKRIYAFAIGAVVGNVAEVGVGWKPDASTRLIFSRALTVDGGGTPTTITVLSTDQFVLTYRLYVKVPDADVPFTYTDGATTYTVNARPLFAAAANGYANLGGGFWGASSSLTDAAIKETDILPAIDGTWSTSGQFSSASYTPPAYINGSFKQTLQAVFAGSGGNFATGVGSVRFYTRDGAGRWMFNFSPKIPKVAGQSLILTFELTWARGTPP